MVNSRKKKKKIIKISESIVFFNFLLRSDALLQLSPLMIINKS